jgi:hypothetical protein
MIVFIAINTIPFRVVGHSRGFPFRAAGPQIRPGLWPTALPSNRPAGKIEIVIERRPTRCWRPSCATLTRMPAPADNPILAPRSMRCTASGLSAWCCSARGRGATHTRITITTWRFFCTTWLTAGRSFDRLADLSTDILGKTGEFIRAIPYRAGSYEDRTSLMREIRFEGVDL